MTWLFIFAVFSLGFGLCSLLAVFYLGFTAQAEPGSKELLICSFASLAGMTLGDIAVALMYKQLISGHWWSTILLLFLTVLAGVAFFITLSVWRDKQIASP